MEDQRREYLISMAVRTLGITRKAAEMRINAFLKSGLIDRLGLKPEDKMFPIVVDIAMQIPQTGNELE